MEKKIDIGGSAGSPGDLRELHALGLAFAEVAISEPASFSPLVREYRHLKESLGLYLLCHGPREGDPNDVRALESGYYPKILQILPIMNRLDMHLLTLHLWLDRRFIKEQVLSFKIQLLNRIVLEASRRKITICIENLSEEARDMARALAEIPDLMITLDLGHAQLLSEENRSFGFLSECPARVKHIHMHDNRGGNSHLDDAHLPPGQGTVDFKNIFKIVRRIGYEGTLTLELKPKEIRSCLPYVKSLLREDEA
jgi:sugar phosphate isomerase/epimerase